MYIFRTIYAMERTHTEPSLSLEPPAMTSDTTDNVFDNLKHVDILTIKEKSYIQSSLIHKDNPKFDRQHFKHQILQDYKKPMSDVKAASYCSPSNSVNQSLTSVYDPTDDAVHSVVIPARQQKVKTRHKQKPRRCNNPCHYCDVLGPQTCSLCIEKTNRYIAKQVERNTLPKVGGSMLSLVAPDLSQTRNKGEKFKQYFNQGKNQTTKPSQSTDNPARYNLQSRRTSFALPPVFLHKSAGSIPSR